MNRWTVGGWLGMVVVLGAVIGLMLVARRGALETYGTTAAQAEWDQWRQSAAEQAAAGGPVQRKVPRSAEPPALVLMRDHFGACLGAALVAALGVYGTFVLLLRGAFRSPPPAVD
ncbi:MAG: hypothetical protein U0935_25340 [Pirellulales bacterium]